MLRSGSRFSLPDIPVSGGGQTPEYIAVLGLGNIGHKQHG
jgi:hypothetical protein